MENGYALFMVKPTQNLEILTEFIGFLDDRGYQIIDKTSKKLTKRQVLDNFFGILDLNIDYLTSDYTHAIWCKIEAEDVSEYVYETKMLFREKYGIQKMQLVNLVHSSDDGLEMMLQKQLFFPQYTPNQYARGCDMYLNVSEFINAADVRNALGTNIRNIYILIDSKKDYEIALNLSSEYSVSVIKREKYIFHNRQIGFLLYYYRRIEDFGNTRRCGKIMAEFPKTYISNEKLTEWSELRDYPSYYRQVKEFFFEYFEMYHKELKEHSIDIDGILVEQGNNNLLESNCLYFYAAANKLAMSAGSGEKRYVGKYYMPCSFEKEFWEHEKSRT